MHCNIPIFCWKTSIWWAFCKKSPNWNFLHKYIITINFCNQFWCKSDIFCLNSLNKILKNTKTQVTRIGGLKTLTHFPRWWKQGTTETGKYQNYQTQNLGWVDRNETKNTKTKLSIYFWGIYMSSNSRSYLFLEKKSSIKVVNVNFF